jgi:hypothetical protein
MFINQFFRLNHMDKNNYNCYYHPERNAVAQCEKCNRLICLECNMVSHRINDKDRYHYATHHDYCIVCYYDKKIKRYSPSPKKLVFLSPIIFIISLLVLMGLAETSRFPYFILPIVLFSIILLLLIYKLFIDEPKKIVNFKIKKYEFLDSLNHSAPVIYCPECGERLEPDVKICNFCGNFITVEPKIS